MLIALVASGHVLIEGVPGLGKTLLARALAQVDRAALRARPVHARHAAVRHHRPRRARRGARGTAACGAARAARAGVHQHPARRRDQPRAGEDAERAARGDAGVPGDARGRDARARAAVLRPRDAEPGRYRGHVSAARGAARPLPAQDRDRLSVAPRRGGDRRAHDRWASAASSCRSTRCAECIDASELLALQDLASQVRVDERVVDYAVRIGRATRGGLGLAAGSGPRGAIAMVRAARAAALLEGRDFVTPDDVKRCALPALAPPRPARARRPARGPARRRTARRRCSRRSRRRASESSPGRCRDASQRSCRRGARSRSSPRWPRPARWRSRRACQSRRSTAVGAASRSRFASRSPRSTSGRAGAPGARAPLRWQRRLPPGACGRRAPGLEGSARQRRQHGRGTSRCSIMSILASTSTACRSPSTSPPAPPRRCATRCCRAGAARARFGAAELRVRTDRRQPRHAHRRRRRGDAARLSELRRGGALCLARRRPAPLRDRHQELPACAAAAPTSSSSPTTGRATRSGTSTGRRRCATAARSCASTRTSATRASSSCSTAAGACAPTKGAPGGAAATSTPRSTR